MNLWQKGQQTLEVANTVGATRRSVRRWKARFSKEGEQGVVAKKTEIVDVFSQVHSVPAPIGHRFKRRKDFLITNQSGLLQYPRDRVGHVERR
jgi:hypothetical protein